MDKIHAQFNSKLAGEFDSLAKEFIVGGAFLSLCLSYFFNQIFLLYFPFSFLAFIVNLNFRSKKITLTLFSIFITWFIILFFIQLSDGFHSWKQIALVFCHFFISLILYKKIFSRFTSYGPAIILSFVFIVLMIIGANPETIFPNNSKNYISIILISSIVFSVIARKEKSNLRVLLFLCFLNVVISIWAGGRGGILVSILIFSFLVFLKFSLINFKPIAIGYLIKFFLIFTVLSLCILIIFFAVQSDMLSGFNQKGLESASRLFIWYSYLNELSSWSAVFGMNPDELSFVERWGGNLHNSYFSAHAHLGLLYIIIILFIFLYFLKNFKDNKLVVIMISGFMVRAFTDIGMLSGHFDLLLISSFLYLYTNKRRKNEKNI